MKTLYLEIFSGISGDMFLGALLDLGADFEQLKRELAKLNLGGYHLHLERGSKSGIAGVLFSVHLETDHHHDEHGDDHAHEHGYGHEHGHGHRRGSSRDFSKIRELILGSALSDWARQKAVAVFHRIAVAEGKIHGRPPEQVTFHEVGAVDSIVDIVGACIALEMLGQPHVLAGPVVEGTGWVECAHGRLPVPVPATLEILGARGVPITQCEEPHELITPTGAALLAEFAESFGPMQNLAAARIGYGLGVRDNKTRPNLLRACLGEAASGDSWEMDIVAVLETNLDDISPEILGHFVERALEDGALDVFHTPIQMKKNRPGVLLTVLCAVADADKFTELMLRETSAFGVRRYTVERRKLQREFVAVKTPYGEVTVKLGKLDGKVVQVAPEYESCKKLAAAAEVPIKQVYEATVAATRERRVPEK
jgi:pyridinium-3,5-bisthiocarboxylic acid mononucleotide nickel chelatase